MVDFRCSKCNKLLGKVDGNAEIVCPRCKTMNEIREEIRKNYEEDIEFLEMIFKRKGESQDDQ